jgi:integrase
LLGFADGNLLILQMQAKITQSLVDGLTKQDRDYFVWDEMLKGFGVKVTATGSKIFVYQFRLGGRGTSTQRFRIGDAESWKAAVARIEAKSLERKVDQGIDPIEAQKQALAEKQRQAEADADTVRSLLPTFIADEYSTRGKTSGTEVKRIFEKYIFPKIGNRPVAKVTSADIEAILDGLLARNVPIMANRTLSALRRFFRWLKRKKRKITSNPTEDLDAPSAEADRDRVLTSEEIRVIWRAADLMGAPYGPFVQMLFLTAQRRDEVAGMCDAELDLRAGIWMLARERTKNRQAHVVPMPQAALQVWGKLETAGKLGLRFTTTGKAPISGYSQYKRRLDEKVLEVLKGEAVERGEDPERVEPLAPWRIHDIRRTVRTALAQLGASENVAERLLNHATYSARRATSVSLVYNRYKYLAERRQAIEAWASLLASIVNPPSTAQIELKLGKVGRA